MAHYGTLRNVFPSAATDDIRGAHVYGKQDKKLGKIADVIFDHNNGNIIYVVVDTGGWLSSKKFILPANQLSESARHEHDYVVDLGQDQIEKFPAYSEQDLESEESWDLYENRYRDSWSEGSILHREGSSRAITPPPQDVAGATASKAASSGPREVENAEADLEAASAPGDRVFPASGRELDRNPVPGSVGSRWEAFQESLRNRRKEVTSSCPQCGKSADTATGGERNTRGTGT